MNLHNSTMHQSRGSPFFNRSFSNGSQDPSDLKPSFSSLFTSHSNNNNNNVIPRSLSFESFPNDSSGNDDDGIFLQISNLDQWYDEINLRNYLMSQLKPITPILSLTIETPSIAKVKVPSVQVNISFSHLHFAYLSLFFLSVCQAGCLSYAS